MQTQKKIKDIIEYKTRISYGLYILALSPFYLLMTVVLLIAAYRLLYGEASGMKKLQVFSNNLHAISEDYRDGKDDVTLIVRLSQIYAATIVLAAYCTFSLMMRRRLGNFYKLLNQELKATTSIDLSQCEFQQLVDLKLSPYHFTDRVLATLYQACKKIPDQRVWYERVSTGTWIVLSLAAYAYLIFNKKVENEVIHKRGQVNSLMYSVIVIGVNALLYTQILAGIIGWSSGKVRRHLLGLLENSVRTYGAQAGFALHPENGFRVDEKHEIVDINFIRPSKHSRKFESLILTFFSYAETGVPATRNIIYLCWKMYYNKFFPIPLDIISQVSSCINEQDEIEKAFSRYITGSSHNIFDSIEFYFDLDIKTAKTALRLNGRSVSQESLDEIHVILSEIFNKKEICHVAQYNKVQKEIVLVLSPTCRGEGIKNCLQLHASKQRKKHQTIRPVYYDNVKDSDYKYASRNIKRSVYKVPELSIFSRFPLIRQAVKRELCQYSQQYIKQHADLFSEMNRVNNLLQNRVLGPGRCRGSGLVRVGKDERHKNTRVPGVLKIKMKSKGVSWRICITRCDCSASKEVYEIVAVYKKNTSTVTSDPLKKLKNKSQAPGAIKKLQ